MPRGPTVPATTTSAPAPCWPHSLLLAAVWLAGYRSARIRRAYALDLTAWTIDIETSATS